MMAVKVSTLKYGSIVGILLLIGVVVLFSAAYTVDEREQVVITQFGEPIGEPITNPGLHFKVPFIQDVRRFDKRLMRWDGDVNQIPTLGREFIVVDTTARWRVIDPLLFLKSVRSEEGAQSRLDDIIDSVVRDKISSTDLEEIVRSKDFVVDPDAANDVTLQRDDLDLSKPKKGREELTREILAGAQLLMPQYGVELLDLRIKRLNYIDSVRRKVEERMVSERQRVAEQFRSEGQGRSAEIDGETERSVRVIVSEAEREAETIRGEADATATSIYGESFSADPEFYAFFKTLESYRTSVADNTTLVLPADSRFYRYLQDVGVAE
ncbi:MAG: protease modulator HflC [Sumerlaeia bacterium]